jgi:chitinase
LAEADAWKHIAGYSIYNDGSIREWQGTDEFQFALPESQDAKQHTMQTITGQITAGTRGKLKQIAEARNMTLPQLVGLALTGYANEHQP